MHHGVAGAQGQGAGHFGGRAQAAALEDVALCAAFALQVAGIGAQIQEAVLHLLGGVSGHKRALALAAHDQVFGGQFIDGLAHRALADLEAGCQLHFTGDQFSGAPFASFRLCRIRPLICWYRGLKAGVETPAPPLWLALLSGLCCGAGHSWFEGIASAMRCTKQSI
jgi:hypothetical protein